MLWSMHVYVYVRQGSYITNVNILKTESNAAFHVFPQARYDFPGGSESKASVYNTGDLGSFSRLGRFPGEGNSNPLQYSCLENPLDGRAWCRLLSMGSQRVRHDWATSLSYFLSFNFIEEWLTKSIVYIWNVKREQRSLVGYSPWYPHYKDTQSLYMWWEFILP